MQQNDSAIGQIIDGFRILGVLGKGGMGIVYKAEDTALSRIVALKMIAPELSSNESFLRRFHSEARALARVESPFIVGVHALRRIDDRFFIVMEFVDGWTLADEIEKGPLDPLRARPVMEQMLQAFARAHGGGVIHRDIKPSNIMITREGRVKVTDFGLAKLRQDDGGSTATQGMAGTARYMSPEQIHGTDLDHRSDIYSLGMTMYEMLAGRLPFDPEEGTFAILKRIVEETFPPPDTYNPNIPKSLVGIVQKAIEKHPDDRFQSAQDMLDGIEEAYRSAVNVERTMIYTPTESKAEARRAPRPAPGADRASVRPSAPVRAAKTGDRSKKIMLAVAFAVVAAGSYPAYRFLAGDSGMNTSEMGSVEPTDPGANPALAQTRLTVNTLPEGAMVYVNQHRVGQAPANHDVAGGQVSIRAEMVGYIRKDTVLTVQSGQPASIVLELDKEPGSTEPAPAQQDPRPPQQPAIAQQQNTTSGQEEAAAEPTGTLNLTAVPAGRITVDGQRYNNVARPTLAVGRHTVQFEDPASGARKDTTIVVREGANPAISCYFEHKLNINARTGWVTVAIEEKDETYSTPIADLMLKPGVYHISASRQGYRILEGEKTLVVEPVCGEEQPVHRILFTPEAIEKE